MLDITSSVSGGVCTISVGGNIDSSNAEEFSDRVAELDKGEQLVFDFESLHYISSAGLRVLLRLRKKHSDLELKNLSAEVYEIFDMTGFTDMMRVSRAYRSVSIEGCEIVGQGANGTVYRIDPDTVVKVYQNADALPDIEHEREVARKALVWGIPTAISYDVVKVGSHYASMFEMLNAKSLSRLLVQNPDNMEAYAHIYVDLMKLIHGTLVPKGELPDQQQTVLRYAREMQPYLPQDVAEKLLRLIEGIPHNDHMIHGDFHTKNIMLQSNDEVLLIDMDTLAVGDPIFEFCAMYNAYVGFVIIDPVEADGFLGYDYATGVRFWKRSLELYFGTTDPDVLLAYENKAKLLGMLRIMRRCKRRNKPVEQFEAAKNWVCSLTRELDSLA